MRDFFEYVQWSDSQYMASQLKPCKSNALIDSYDNVATMYTISLKLDGVVADNLHIGTKPLETPLRQWNFVNFPVDARHFLNVLIHL